MVADIFSAAELDAMEIPEPRWAIPGVFPQGASLLVGAPKLGKSWLLLNAGVAIASGTLAFGQVLVEPGGVLLLCLEDTKQRLQDRVRRVMNGNSMPTNLKLATSWPRLDEGGAEALGDYLTKHPDTRLVGIDVLTRLRSTEPGRAARLYEQDYATLADFKRVADKHKVALVAVHHTRKMAADDPFDRVSGTNRLAGAADTTLVMTRTRDSKSARLYMRGRDVQECECALTSDPDTCLWTLEANTAKALAISLPPKQREIADLLAAHDGLTPAEIAEALGANHSTMRNQLRTMLLAGNVEKREERYFPAALTISEHSRQDRQPVPTTNRQTRQDGQLTVLPSTPSSVSRRATHDDLSSLSSASSSDDETEAGPGSSWHLPIPLRGESHDPVPSDCGAPKACAKLGRCSHYSASGCPVQPKVAPEPLEAAS